MTIDFSARIPEKPAFVEGAELTPFDRLHLAAVELLAAKRMLAIAQAKRTAALVAINEVGCPKRRVSEVAQQHLLATGFLPEEIRLLGLSPASVRLVLAPARTLPPATTPEQR